MDDDCDECGEGLEWFDECERYVDEAGDRIVVAIDADLHVSRERVPVSGPRRGS